jgi:hypothetical protein
MADGCVEEQTAPNIELWRDPIADHGRSGPSVKHFAKNVGQKSIKNL